MFGQATVGLTSRLSATAGVRYTHEGKDIDNAGGRYALEAPNLPVPGSVYGYSDSIAHSAWTPKIGLEMKLPNGALAYVSATRGFKSGGFNLSSTAAGRGYAPEWAWSYEGGWKGTLMGGRSRLDVSAFVMDYTNLQVQTPIGIGVFDIRNAAAATIRGVEVENTSRIGRGIEAGGHLTWLDATYDRYIAVDNERHRRRRGQPAEQRPGVGGAPVDRVDRRHRPIATTVHLGRLDGAVDGVLHTVQRQHPATGSVWPARRPRRIRTQPSSVDGRRACPKPHEHGRRLPLWARAAAEELRSMPERPSWTPAPMSPDGVRSFRQQLTVGEDAVDVTKWFPESCGIPPRVRVGRNRWFNLLWLLPIGFVVLISAVAVAQGLRTIPSVEDFIARYPGTIVSAEVKWIKGLEFVADFADIGGGYGGYHQDHEFFGQRQSI